MYARTHTHTHNTSVWFVLTFNKIIISFWPFLSNVFINFRLPTYRPLMSETTWTLQRHGDRAEFILSDSKWTQNRTVRYLFVPIANGIPCYLGFSVIVHFKNNIHWNRYWCYFKTFNVNINNYYHLNALLTQFPIWTMKWTSYLHYARWLAWNYC